MHLLHILSSADPAHGGTSEFVATLLRNLPPGDTAELLTLDSPASPWLRDLPYPGHALGPVGTTYSYTPKLRPWLRANLRRFDGVVLHGLWQFCGLALLLESSKPIPYVVLPHGMLDPYFQNRSFLQTAKKSLYWLFAEYWVLRKARWAVFTTAEESRLARRSFRLHRWNPAVIPFGTVAPPSTPELQREAFFALQPGLRPRRFLLYLGRIHPKKGCDLLLEAFARVAAADPALELVMAGPDPQGWAAHLKLSTDKSGIASRVHWTGMLTGDAKWGAFRAAEAFILPSHQENFGIAVAEALACACTVLLSDKINIASDIASEGAGFVEPDTLEGTETLLRRWIATPPVERNAIAARALACFQARYDMCGTANAIHQLLSETPS